MRDKIETWIHILDRLSICKSENEEEIILNDIAGLRKTAIVSFMNAHSANIAWEDSSFRRDLHRSDILLRDGIGMKILLSMLNRDAGLNLNGTDFIPKLLRLAGKEATLAVYGTQEPYLSAGIDRIKVMGFALVHSEHGFYEDNYYVARFKQTRPSIVILAMGMPKQERVSVLLKEAALENDNPSLIINGGAIIDFMAGRFSRAPKRMQVLGIEWVFRLVQEPKRLWRRNIIGNSVFIFRSVLTSLSVLLSRILRRSTT